MADSGWVLISLADTLTLWFVAQINSAVFMKVNSASINMLRLAGSYVTYGPPNLKTVWPLSLALLVHAMAAYVKCVRSSKHRFSDQR